MKCAYCGKEFARRGGQKYCSAECLEASRKVKCAYCGKEFVQLYDRRQKYCSHSCSSQAMYERKTTCHCLNCGKKFMRNFVNERFCSDACRIDYFY